MLTAIAGAMVALLGFVVTIGVLVVQQATGTLSPRYMRLWYRDRLQKGVLAHFAGTFTFAFGLLRRIEDDFVPDIGVTLAGVAVAASLGLLLIYLDRFTHRLRPVAVAALRPTVRPGRSRGLDRADPAPAPPTKATRPPLLRAAVRCGTFRPSASGRCRP